VNLPNKIIKTHTKVELESEKNLSNKKSKCKDYVIKGGEYLYFKLSFLSISHLFITLITIDFKAPVIKISLEPNETPIKKALQDSIN